MTGSSTHYDRITPTQLNPRTRMVVPAMRTQVHAPGTSSLTCTRPSAGTRPSDPCSGHPITNRHAPPLLVSFLGRPFSFRHFQIRQSSRGSPTLRSPISPHFRKPTSDAFARFLHVDSNTSDLPSPPVCFIGYIPSRKLCHPQHVFQWFQVPGARHHRAALVSPFVVCSESLRGRTGFLRTIMHSNRHPG